MHSLTLERMVMKLHTLKRHCESQVVLGLLGCMEQLLLAVQR